MNTPLLIYIILCSVSAFGVVAGGDNRSPWVISFGGWLAAAMNEIYILQQCKLLE